jgi:hypothetical protein
VDAECGLSYHAVLTARSATQMESRAGVLLLRHTGLAILRVPSGCQHVAHGCSKSKFNPVCHWQRAQVAYQMNALELQMREGKIGPTLDEIGGAQQVRS